MFVRENSLIRTPREHTHRKGQIPLQSTRVRKNHIKSAVFVWRVVYKHRYINIFSGKHRKFAAPVCMSDRTCGARLRW